MSALRPMSDPDRRSSDPDRRLLRELYDEISRLGHQVEKIADRMESVAVLAQRVETNAQEIIGLRVNVAAALERITRVESVQPRAIKKSENGALRVQPVWLTAILAVVGMVLTGLWQVINWIIDLARQQ